MEQNLSTYDKNTIEFLTVAAQFCALLENPDNEPKAEFIDKMTKIMPLLYVKAQMLTTLQPSEFIDIQDSVTEEDYNFVRNKVAAIMAADDDYLDVFIEDMKYSDQPILATVSENFADIYQEVKNFVAIFMTMPNDDVAQEAVALCYDNFANHWGQKLVNVIRQLHAVKYNNQDHSLEDEI